MGTGGGLPATPQRGQAAGASRHCQVQAPIREMPSTLQMLRPWAVGAKEDGKNWGVRVMAGPEVGQGEPEQDADTMVEPTEVFRSVSLP